MPAFKAGTFDERLGSYQMENMNTITTTPDKRVWYYVNYNTAGYSACEAYTMCKTQYKSYPVRPMSKADIDALKLLTKGAFFWIGAKGDPDVGWQGRWTTTCPPNTADFGDYFRWWPNSDLSSTYSPPLANNNSQAFYFDSKTGKFLSSSGFNNSIMVVCEKTLANSNVQLIT